MSLLSSGKLSMPKDISSLTLVWWVAGAFAALVITIPPYLKRLDQRTTALPTEEIGRTENKPSEGESAQANADTGTKSHQAPKPESLEVVGRELKISQGASQLPTLDPKEVYRALTSPDPTERGRALEITARSPEVLYEFNAIYKRLIELSSDRDKQVGKHARVARAQLQDLRARHEIPEPSEGGGVDPEYGGSVQQRDVLESAVEPFEALRAKALDDPDPGVRMGGIESAMNQRDEQIFEVLSQAARSDYEPDNRMTAVSEVEQMLKSGLGDREQILRLLEETAADPDPRIAELSQLIIREQFGEDNL